ncbi:MAG: helix-turn-helix domain-containing protein [Oscillospiraceae bacterium]|nr:helix-turn-helix domain-containing protein [Oscillospiraceae bacterium]MBP3329791.1 helix-turn-helix domain-containing protein [Clostridia bacterium]
MDSVKMGALFRKLRTEKGFTQAQVAEKLLVSDKAVSKWERGLGCPDISVLNDIAELFGVPVETLLDGEITSNNTIGGNMKRVKFYICTECGNIFTAAASGEISCCGRKLAPLEAVAPDKEHTPKIEDIDGEFYVTFSHEMTKAHYITFAAYASCDRVHLVKLYPEQDPAIRLPRIGGGVLYFYCNKHGFMKVKI